MLRVARVVHPSRSHTFIQTSPVSLQMKRSLFSVVQRGAFGSRSFMLRDSLAVHSPSLPVCQWQPISHTEANQRGITTLKVKPHYSQFTPHQSCFFFFFFHVLKEACLIFSPLVCFGFHCTCPPAWHCFVRVCVSVSEKIFIYLFLVKSLTDLKRKAFTFIRAHLLIRFSIWIRARKHHKFLFNHKRG